MEFAGLPLHPLVVHLALALVPLAALSAWALAVLPSWRWLTRWAALPAAVLAVGGVVVARVSGQSLLDDRRFLTSPESPVADLIETHQARSLVLFGAVIALAVLVVLAFWLLPAPTGLASGKLDHRGRAERWVAVVVPVSLVVVGAVALVWLGLTGDAGARAVWEV
jgi:hypothetical protein